MNIFFKLQLLALFIFICPFSLIANDNIFQFRDVKIGLTKEAISKLDSVKFGFMPMPSKKICKKGIYYYSPPMDKIHTYQYSEYEYAGSKTKIWDYANEIIICSEKDGLLSDQYKLQGPIQLWSNYIDYKFYKNKLYMLEIYIYPPSNINPNNYTYLKNPSGINPDKYISDIFKKIKKQYDVSLYSIKNKEVLINKPLIKKTEINYKSTINKSLKVELTKYKTTKQPDNPHSGHVFIRFELSDSSIVKKIKDIGDNLLSEKVKKFRDKKNKKINQEKLFKNKSEELNKKFEF